MDVCCFRCSHVFEVAGEPDGWWRCDDCVQDDEERATEHRAALWHGWNGPQNDRERDEVRR